MSDALQDLHPFEGKGRVPPSRTSFERRHRLARPDLFREALEQLLAGLSPSEISPEDVRVLAEGYGLDPYLAHDLALELWLAALDVFLGDDAGWPTKNAYLRALQAMLDLDDADVVPARVKAVAPRFKRALREVVADLVITGDERARMARLADDLGIPAGTARQAIDRTARTILDQIWVAVTDSGTLTADGVARMRAAAEALGVPPTPRQEAELRQAEATLAAAQARAEAERAYREQEAAERLRRLQADRERLAAWLSRPSAPPPAPGVPTPIELEAGETEVWTEPVEWHELVVDQTDPFAGPRLTFEDRGALHVTDRRLVFVGRRMLRTIRLADIGAGIQYPDALRICRRVDRDVFFLPEHDERVALLVGIVSRVAGWTAPSEESQPARALAAARPSPQR